MIITHSGKPAVACLVQFTPNLDSVVFYPIHKVLELAQQNRSLLKGPPLEDLKDDAYCFSLTSLEIKFIKDQISYGTHAILVQIVSEKEYKIKSCRIRRLKLTEQELNWLNLYCQFTLDEHEALLKESEQQPTVIPIKKPKKPKLKAKDRRKLERQKRGKS